VTVSIETYRNRPTRAEISLSNLKNNYEIVKSLVDPSARVMAVVKANAYGHGLLRITRELLEYGADSIGVAYLEEAVYLRKSGITAPILVMGAINTDQVADFIEHDIEITSSSFEKSRAISEVASRLGKKAAVHIKVDTGMERIGVHWFNAGEFILRTFDLPGIEVAGVFSHLAKAESDKQFTDTQVTRFTGIIEFMDKRNLLPEQIHLANSAGIINNRSAHFTLVRPGIMLYGYNPNGYMPEKPVGKGILKPVMTLKTKVSYFKVTGANTGISYNHTHITSGQTRIVTLPVGYGDGYNRLLSNRGRVVIRGKEYPVAGMVCMDQVMVDIGMDGTAYNGDDVLLFGEMDGWAIPLESLCDAIGTITYEFLCCISSRVPRIYIS
jgi:alanine racemase